MRACSIYVELICVWTFPCFGSKVWHDGQAHEQMQQVQVPSLLQCWVPKEGLESTQTSVWCNSVAPRAPTWKLTFLRHGEWLRLWQVVFHLVWGALNDSSSCGIAFLKQKSYTSWCACMCDLSWSRLYIRTNIPCSRLNISFKAITTPSLHV